MRRTVLRAVLFFVVPLVWSCTEPTAPVTDDAGVAGAQDQLGTARLVQFEVGPYDGTATLCAVDMTGFSQETRGRNGVIYTYSQVLVFRINTTNPMIRGWEVLTSNNKAPSQSAGGYYWGEAVLSPDSYGGALVDHFKFPVAQADRISGTYRGAGDLAGVVAEYVLTPAGVGDLPLDACTNDMPYECEAPGCSLLPSGIAGYLMSGQVIRE